MDWSWEGRTCVGVQGKPKTRELSKTSEHYGPFIYGSLFLDAVYLRTKIVCIRSTGRAIERKCDTNSLEVTDKEAIEVLNCAIASSFGVRVPHLPHWLRGVVHRTKL